MSKVTDLCQDGYDNVERPDRASVPSLRRSSKRLRDKKESSNDAHPRNENGSENKTATGSVESLVDLEIADKVEESPHKKRRGVLKSKESGKNDAAGKCAQIMRGGHATETDVDSEDSKQTSRNDGSTNSNSQKLPNSKSQPNASERRCWASRWEGRLSELADYRKIHGNCNVPTRYNENPKLGTWVGAQRIHYRLKRSYMTLSRIQELESMGFEWGTCSTAWEVRLSELADFRKIHGHCNVPVRYSKTPELGRWVVTQRYQYRFHLEGKKSPMTTVRIQKLESLGFEWKRAPLTAWEVRLSELADFCKIHGHCNVPKHYSKNPKLANWVATQRFEYRLHLKGKTSPMIILHIQKLEGLGFEWDSHGTTWEDRLGEFADYRKIHGNCNVPNRYSESPKLANWVANQRYQYRLQLEGKKSHMTPRRIQALESLSFEWKPSISRRRGTPQKPSLDDDATRVHKKPANSRQGANSQLKTAPSIVILRATGYH
jgi:hypothetical protein